MQLQCFVNQIAIQLVKLVFYLRFDDLVVHGGNASAFLVWELFVELIDL